MPFSSTVGAAAFRRGSAGYVVFDARRPIDMAALAQDPVFGAARITLLPRGTLLRVPLAPALHLVLAHRSGGWAVAVTGAPLTARALASRVSHGALVLPLPGARDAIVVPDPTSGTDLLVGTTDESDSATLFSRRLPGFILLRTWLGVAVEPHSDNLVLRPTAHGFALGAGGAGALPLAPAPTKLAAAETAASLTRRFALPSLPLAALARALTPERVAITAAPPRARFAPRLAEARTLIALGMGREAKSLLDLALAEDPRHASDPGVLGLRAIAQVLAGHPASARALNDPRLSGTDEVTLWRAIRAELIGEDPTGTAPVLATLAPLILTYSDPLIRFLAPIAARAMISGRDLAGASAFLSAAPKTARLDLERAALLAARGDRAAALAAYGALAHSLDRPVAARAATRVILLRFTMGHSTAAAAARALSRQFYAWRGPRHELRLRLKVAQLRAAAGEWRAAFALLRRTQALFPADADTIAAERSATFQRLFTTNAIQRMNPLDVVSLIESNADLIPSGAAGENLANLLAERLLALDLPRQAAAVLAKLMREAPPGIPAALLGAKLAGARLAQGEPKAALKALAASRAADLPQALAEQRTILYARATAAIGRPGRASAALAALDSPAALALRAKLSQKAKRWADAEAALVSLAAQTVSAKGALSTRNKKVLVDLANAAGQEEDASELRALRSAYGPRMGNGLLADTFRILTDPPARTLADLPEVTRDTAIAERLPEEIKAIGGATEILR